jgi:glycolate oxidase FAD binding subunit
MTATDSAEQLKNKVLSAFEENTALNIQGSGTKYFYGNSSNDKILCTKSHQGIINYEPTELVITARAGTPLKTIEQTLADNNQILAFEPPYFGDDATLGGTIACNLSGPRRAYAGAARDFVLGTRVINGKGKIISFGGEVMKNVAGYDVSRLMTGALGTLGVLLDVSLKVLPKPETELTLVQKADFKTALKTLTDLSRTPLPVSASCYHDGFLHIRLSGTEGAVNAAKQTIGGDIIENTILFWQSVKEHQYTFFDSEKSLWRLSLAADTPSLSLQGEELFEWGGALRWLLSDDSEENIRSTIKSHGGHATLFRSDDKSTAAFQALDAPLLKIQKNLKQAFDPKCILNPGRMYKEI